MTDRKLTSKEIFSLMASILELQSTAAEFEVGNRYKFSVTFKVADEHLEIDKSSLGKIKE